MSKKVNKDEIKISHNKLSYALGWNVVHDAKSGNLKQVYHTGGAVGASSCLLIIPGHNTNQHSNEPNGLVVSVLCNTQDVMEIVKFTNRVARLFNKN